MSGTARVTLQGRRILVTGGSKGIGREIALAAAEADAEVVVAARGEEAVQATVLAEGGVPMRASAELAVFLLSDEARGVSGKLISAVSDDWRDAEFRARRVADPDLATLRRIDDLRYRRVR